ncbi:DUF1559 domain-containing protein [Tundrisphaera sp. TA3]|uniref:DUF1559 family PulG-like putative transporter n=1 Tax=Tundrisphaera sp. TA3 TaxID=3435775 RepID=UPI003EBC6ABE
MDSRRNRPASYRRRPPLRRGGFTLIELLAVCGVISLLLGLVLPAVQASREAARRLQCVANLKQIGIALNAYHATNAMYPGNMLLTTPSYSSNHLSALARILPFADMTPLYNSINLAFVNAESADRPSLVNRTARHTTVALFLCPSDAGFDHKSSYRFNRGRFAIRPGEAFDGPFGVGVRLDAGAVADGLSQTAFVSERIGGGFSTSAGFPRDAVIPDASTGPDRLTSDVDARKFCADNEPAAWITTNGRYWFYNGVRSTDYNHNGLPNDPQPSCEAGVNASFCPPRSYHRGGVNVLLGDGHVAKVLDSVAVTVWTALGTHDAGDLAPGEF